MRGLLLVPRRGLAAAVSTLAAVTPGAASTTAADTRPPLRVESAQRGALRATLTYRDDPGETVEARLRIFRSGRLLVDDRLLPPCSGCGVVPRGARRGSSLSVLDLDADADLEVLVDLGLGGNYDIPYTYFYFQRRAGTSVAFDRISRVWGAFGVARRDLNRDGRPEFVSHDPRFFGRFSCSGCSRGPIQIWRFRSARLLDVTRSFPHAIERDLQAYRACLPDRAGRGEDQRGCLPAWAGDQVLLGRSRLVWPMLRAALANGNLGPRGRAYIGELRAYLRQTGYR